MNLAPFPRVLGWVRINRSTGTTNVRYFHQDQLGSIAAITDESSTVVERNSYDAWGKRRFLNGVDDPSGSLNTSSQTLRGFTARNSWPTPASCTSTGASTTRSSAA